MFSYTRLFFDLQKIKLKGVYISFKNDVHLAATVRATRNICLQPQTAYFVKASIKNSPYFLDEKEYSLPRLSRAF